MRINNIGTTDERKDYLTALKEYFSAFHSELCKDCHQRLFTNPLRILDCKNPTCKERALKAPVIFEFLKEETTAEFETLKNHLKQSDVAFVVDPYIVRGLDYYEKTAFEFTSDLLGSQSTFAGGGRYNKLSEELGGPKIPGVGFGLGLERLILMLEHQEAENNTNEKMRPSGISFVCLGSLAQEKGRQLAQALRDLGVRVDLDYAERSFKAQMRRADRSGLSHALILGDNELQTQMAPLKNMLTGEQVTVDLQKADDIKTILSL